MKSETLNSCIIAKSLFDKAQDLCIVEDKYITSAGLVILQDALELVLYACLIELGIDQEKAIEKFSFDQLIGELNQKGKKVNKSGTLKALNKQRVLIKHFGQLAEPETVKNFFNVTKISIDALLNDVVGRDLQEIMLHDLIHKEEIQEYFKKAEQFIKDKKYFLALTEIRKAIFIEIEDEYSIEGWKDYVSGEERNFLRMLLRGGTKSPWHTKNKKWIEENISEPYDFIQLDHDRLRLDLIEWGVSTQDFWNLWRLTPKLFRFRESNQWIVKKEPMHVIEGATEANVKYCLDRAVSLIMKKQGHFDLSRSLNSNLGTELKVKIIDDQPLFEKASTNSKVIAEVKKEDVYTLNSVTQGLDGEEIFGKITKFVKDPPIYQAGYILYKFIEIVE